MTLEELQALLQPSQADRDNALNMGLLQAGLGILANNTNKRNPMPALGAGGLMGLQGYQQSMQQGRKDQMDRLQMMMLLNKLKKEEELNKAILGDAPQQTMQYATADRPISLSDSSRYTDGTQRPMIQPQGQQNAFEMIPKQIRSAMLLAGKPEKLGEMAWEATKPNKQVHGGYVVDMNQSQNGQLLPQINISANGQMSGIDSTGASFIPRNALENYSQFRNADEAARAGFKLETITPPGGTPILTTTGKVVDKINGRPQDFPRVSPEQQAARDAERKAIVAGELNNPANIGQPGYDALQKEASGLGIPLQSTAQGIYKDTQAKDLSKQMTDIQTSGFVADSKIGKYTQLARLYGDFEGGKLSQSAMDLAKLGNSLGIKIDKNLPNKEAASALSNEISLTLRNPSGGAGMPGAMSDSDREFLRSMTPQLGQTAEGRKMIIDSAIAIEQRNKDIAKFARKYEQKHGAIDSGFYAQLSSWADENRLFGKK